MSSETNIPSDLLALCRKLGTDFADVALLKQALTHKSASAHNNERLEFLGDAVLGLVIAQELFERYPQHHEDGLSLMRAGLVNRNALAALARDLDLGRVVQLGPGELRSGGHERDSILADTLEALLGALLLDAGLARVQQVIKRLFAERLDAAVVTKDAKTRLQEWLQARRQTLPEYRVGEVTGADHARHYAVECVLPDSGETAQGAGSSRRAAEQAAATSMLGLLGENSA